MRTSRSRWLRTLSALIAAAVAVTSFLVLNPLTASAADIDNCTGSEPITCRFDVAPGTYDVTAVLGGDEAGSTVITAESLRTMVSATETAAGEPETVHFTVNVRDPEGQPTGETGNPGLDLYFGGEAPQLSDLTVTEATQQQLFIAGDSTACDQNWPPYFGWGQEAPQFFHQGLSVANYADTGESSGSFLRNSQLFPAMRPLIADGDVVLIQFGHNDKQTSASDFRANLTSMIEEVSAQGGTPVLVTPIVRRRFNDDGTLNNGAALHVNGAGVDLPAEMRDLAESQSVGLIDMTALTKQMVEELGPEESKSLYLTDEEGDNTHTSEHGATEFARLVIGELRDQEMISADLFR